MSEPQLIAEDEYVLRHIPGGGDWQAPPGSRITSLNFALRQDRGETGISVTRLKMTSPERLLKLVGGDRSAGSRVAQARVGDIRALGLRVVPRPLPEDSGHSEIQSEAANLDERPTRKRLAKLFRFVEESPPPFAAATAP